MSATQTRGARSAVFSNIGGGDVLSALLQQQQQQQQQRQGPSTASQRPSSAQQASIFAPVSQQATTAAVPATQPRQRSALGTSGAVATRRQPRSRQQPGASALAQQQQQQPTAAVEQATAQQTRRPRAAQAQPLQQRQQPSALFGAQGGALRPSGAGQRQQQPASIFGASAASPLGPPAGSIAAGESAGTERQRADQRRFFTLNPATFERDGSIYRGQTPDGAARKAVSAGRTNPVLVWDPDFRTTPGGRVYAYEGRIEPITNPTEHTARLGITRKPTVRSIGYVNLNENFAPIRETATGNMGPLLGSLMERNAYAASR